MEGKPIFFPNMDGADSSFLSAGFSSWNRPTEKPLRPEKRLPLSGCGSCCGLVAGGEEGELENNEPKGLAVSVTPDMNPKLGADSPGISNMPLAEEGSGSGGALLSASIFAVLSPSVLGVTSA